MKNRSYALDALRGYAIITMVLSGTIAWGTLPRWMYHAQTPPPTHVFDPTVPGITWVDLVFPFFLFAMGAAFPFSIGKRIGEGYSKLKLVWATVKRYVQLVFFAIMVQQFYPWVTSSPQDMTAWLLALLCFALLFPMFMRMPFKAPEWVHTAIKVAAFALALAIMYFKPYVSDKGFDPNNSNIILLVLANMALFGTLIYIATKNSKVLRLIILPFIMAVFLGKDIEGSITKAIYDFTPLAWAYKFNFIKYLFIVLPGSIAGEYLYEWMNKQKESNDAENKDKSLSIILSLIGIAVIIINLVCLLNRWLVPNLLINIVLLGAGCLLLKNAKTNNQQLWKKLFYCGAYLTLLGLFFEPFEGGIKKDSSTFSYYFMTAGLAFLGMMIFHVLCDFFKYRKATSSLVMSGQNPMIAYVATSILVMPLINIFGLSEYLGKVNGNFFLGLMHGVIPTTIAVLVTMFFTKMKWFWRT